MKTNLFRDVIITTFLLVSSHVGECQGTFRNLDFEWAMIPPQMPLPGQVSITNALPGWTGYFGDNQVDQVWYNARPLSAPGITIQGPFSMYPILQGRYTVL